MKLTGTRNAMTPYMYTKVEIIILILYFETDRSESRIIIATSDVDWSEC